MDITFAENEKALLDSLGLDFFGIEKHKEFYAGKINFNNDYLLEQVPVTVFLTASPVKLWKVYINFPDKTAVLYGSPGASFIDLYDTIYDMATGYIDIKTIKKD